MKDDLFDEIAIVAFDLHQKRGWSHGYDLQDWLVAEKIVLSRYEKGAETEKSNKASKITTKKGK